MEALSKLWALAHDPAFLATCLTLWLALGAVGKAIEAVGAATGSPKIERFGQTLEALFADIDKLRRGSRLSQLEAKSRKETKQ